MKHSGPQYNEVLHLLKEYGATLERSKKHHIWRFPDGRSFSLPGSPSCKSAWENNLHDLKKFLGIKELRGIVGERRPKRLRVKTAVKFTIVPENNFAVRDFKSQLFKIRHKLPPYWAPAFWQYPSTWEYFVSFYCGKT